MIFFTSVPHRSVTPHAIVHSMVYWVVDSQLHQLPFMRITLTFACSQSFLQMAKRAHTRLFGILRGTCLLYHQITGEAKAGNTQYADKCKSSCHDGLDFSCMD